MLNEKTKAPDFELLDENGRPINCPIMPGRRSSFIFTPKTILPDARPRPAASVMITVLLRRSMPASLA